MSRPAKVRRVLALVLKETKQILRDPSSIAIAFVLPALLLFLFGYGVSLDVEHVDVAIVVPETSETADSFASAFEFSEYFEPRVVHDRQTAERALLEGRVKAVVVLREDFMDALLDAAGRPPAQVIVDGTDSNTARIVSGYVQRLWQTWLEIRSQKRGAKPGELVALHFQVWFNPELDSTYFLVPGLVALVMTVTGALLTSLLIAREYDQGTIETLLVSAGGRGEIILGKVGPAFVLGMVSMGLAVAMATLLFGVPLEGSLAVLFAASALFLLAALGMGLLISAVTRNQFVAGQLAIMVTYLPALLLSDMIFNIDSMPAWVQALTYLVAARYFVAILKSVFLVGDVWPVILPNAAALAAMALVFLAVSYLAMRERLE